MKSKIVDIDAAVDAEIFWMLQTAYGDAIMSRRRVFEWYKRFKEGREETADNERSGRPSTSTTPEKVDKVWELVREDRRITVREVAEETGISFGSTQSIMKDILGVRRLNAVLVPKNLTFDQKNARKETASLNLEATTDDPELLKRVIIGDEAWIYGFDSETTQKASEWRFKIEPRKRGRLPAKLRNGRSCEGASRGSSTRITRRRTQPSKSRSSCRTTQPLCSPTPLQSRFGPLRLLPFWKAQKKVKGSEISEHRRDQSGIEEGHEGDPENRLPEVFCRLEKKVAEVHRGQRGLLKRGQFEFGRIIKCFGSSSIFTYKKIDQRTCIKFCVKNEIKCADAFRMLTVAYGEATLDRSNVYRWYKMFSEGRENVNDEGRAGRPSTSTTDEKINEVEKMILANRRITVREVAEDLNISIGSCHSIFINDLGMRRVAAKFKPKLLNCDQKQHRMNIANEMLDSVRDDPNLLQRVITGDEAWVYGYDVETKAQSSQWKLPHEPRPKKARQVRSNVKVLLTVFFDCRGVVHHKFLPQGRTVNKEYYLQVMRNLREAIRQKRPDLLKNKNWVLHHDNAPAHTSLLVRDFLTKHNTLMMPQPPYSPDLAPCDFFLFPKLKRPMKGRRYATFDEIKTASKEELKKIFLK
ncbi:hypothetical protein LAZ67_8000164 [Cordylochernes scorpioides]|uniref:Mos1 transposase HTH domain-containing protein n=1 Tax=Cordylochernes scorpioides TaxID=51811 RepID=A0ABY6KP58_9ARAC|nr:hypothetical protein LAZ67_8000164 [Cordylochernes scorpioides]